MSGHRVHVATFEELPPRTAYLIWQLRESVFVVEQSCPYQELDGLDLAPGTRHVWVEEQGSPVGYLRILAEGTRPNGPARIGRVLVARSWRGQGIAEALMRTALDQLDDRPSALDAQAHLAGWYTRFGFVSSGPEFVEDGIPHVPMLRGQQANAGS